ncbi:MAG: RagB/SusD family nutrient uptake outer membrane protein [Prolixibacteraceae bacterium]|nr:RagB/SusD family nutrient uptake outer membrane protein [Prolixibacteraceae bacterium]
MNNKYFKFLSIAALSLMLAFTSCVNDLDTIPLDKDVVTSATVYDDPAAYQQILAKCYAGLSLTGQEGPAGAGDLGGLDEGFSSYVRGMWNLQELASDHAVTGWGDAGLSDLHAQTWTSSNDFVKGFYYRVYYQITLANEFIRETAPAKLDGRGVTGQLRTDVEKYRAEARFLRALSYWHALDMFGSVPFITEEDGIGSFFPKQATKAELFSYIESELKDIETKLAAPKTNVYGRVDQAAAWMLLAKLYLNAEVYIAAPKYTEAITYSTKVINSGYTLEPKYEKLFLTDNYLSKEIIMPVIADGKNAKTWGSTTFIINGGIGGSMVAANYGVNAAWGGHRALSSLVTKFPIYANAKSANINMLKSAKAEALLYVPGGYQGWDPAKTTTVLRSASNDGKFEGYLYFKDDNTEFKFCETPNWDKNWGDTGANGTLESGGDNIKAAKAGYYKINVDINAKTYTMLKTDWGIIGDATADAWNSDQNMTFDAATNLWTAILDLSNKAIKFRANDGWDLNYGDDGANASLEPGGANISIASAGKYKITLNLNQLPYTYSLEKYSTDLRPMFFTDGQDLKVTDITKFKEGYAVVKFKNISSTGVAGQDLTHSDTDFPMFRLADAHLIYAEAVLRGGTGGSAAQALTYVNAIRTRAYGDAGGNITANELNLNFILDERSREFYWEAQRRTDLIRFGKFTGSAYIWPWKGGVMDGKATDAKYNVYPIPSSDVVANPNLKQNTGY